MSVAALYIGVHCDKHNGTEHIPENTIHWPNVGLVLAQRQRRWPNINPILVQRLVLAGMLLDIYLKILQVLLGGGPRVVVSTAAFHARVRGSVPGLGVLKETKLFLPHPRVKVSIVGSLRDREVACSASERQGPNFETCVWRTVSSHSVISIISPSSGGSPGPV